MQEKKTRTNRYTSFGKSCLRLHGATPNHYIEKYGIWNFSLTKTPHSCQNLKTYTTLFKWLKSRCQRYPCRNANIIFGAIRTLRSKNAHAHVCITGGSTPPGNLLKVVNILNNLPLGDNRSSTEVP